jgi:hypothetical protein
MTVYILKRNYDNDLKVTVPEGGRIEFNSYKGDGVARISSVKSVGGDHESLGYDLYTLIAAFSGITAVYPEGFEVLEKRYDFKVSEPVTASETEVKWEAFS